MICSLMGVVMLPFDFLSYPGAGDPHQNAADAFQDAQQDGVIR